MKAHDLARELLKGPDLEVVYTEEREVDRVFWSVDEVMLVETAPKDNTTIAAPYIYIE